jgi:hypothetical protein
VVALSDRACGPESDPTRTDNDESHARPYNEGWNKAILIDTPSRSVQETAVSFEEGSAGL